MQKCFEVEWRAADDERDVFPVEYLLDSQFCLFQPPGDRSTLPGIETIDQVVANFLPLLPRRLGSTDIHVSIECHRIHGDDFDGKLTSQTMSQRRLS